MADSDQPEMQSECEYETENEFQDCESDSGILSMTDKRKKRKLSPSVKAAMMSKKLSQGLGQGGKKGITFAKTPKTPNPKTPKTLIKPQPPMPFADAMLATLTEPTFVINAAPHMTTMMQPVIDAAIEKAVRTAVDATSRSTDSTVRSIIESNRSLQETVQKQNEIIENQQKIIDSQTAQINTNTTKISQMEKEIKELTNETSALRLELNHVEQYGRRNSVRIQNMKIKQKDFETEAEMKSCITNFINDTLLSPEDNISEEDIDRCHEAGSKTKKQILVKFHKYHVKNKIFGAKSKLKGNKDKIFITEDLTRFNQEIVKTLITLRTNDKIDSFWTRNGTIFIKITDTGILIRIQQMQDLAHHGLK